MNNQYVPTPVQAYYYPPQAMGNYPQALGQTAAPIASSTWWLLGALGAGLYFWSTSQRNKSKDF